MLIGVRKRFVFVANSKAASSAIETALTTQAEITRGLTAQRKHASWREVRNDYDFLFNRPEHAPETFFRFGVVREPVDWVRSWYNYRRARDSDVENISFAEFWQQPQWLHSASQMDIFTDADRQCRFDLVIPYDELDRVMPRILRVLDVPQSEWVKRNVSAGTLKKNEIDPGLRTEIRGEFSRDVEFYQHWKQNFSAAIADMGKRLGVLASSKDAVRVIRHEEPLAPYVQLRLERVHHDAGRSEVDCHGVVVLDRELALDRARLLTLGAECGAAPEWALPSPMLGRRFPDNPHAAHARFRIQRLVLVPGRPAELLLDPGNGTRRPLFRLERI